MAISSALSHHAINYVKRSRGEESVDILLDGVKTEPPKLMSLTERIPFPDGRRIVENFYGLYGDKEFYHLGKDFVIYFADHKEYDIKFPFISMLSLLSPFSRNSFDTFEVFLGIASQVNPAHHYELIAYCPEYVDIAIRKDPRHNSENIDFKLEDKDYLDLVCRQHKGGIEESLRLMKVEKPKIEEVSHQGDKGASHCHYRLWLKFERHPGERTMSLEATRNFYSRCIDAGLSPDNMKAVYWYHMGMTDEQTGSEKLNLEGSSVAKRITKVRKGFGVEDRRALVKLFEREKYFMEIEDKWIKDPGDDAK